MSYKACSFAWCLVGADTVRSTSLPSSTFHLLPSTLVFRLDHITTTSSTFFNNFHPSNIFSSIFNNIFNILVPLRLPSSTLHLRLPSSVSSFDISSSAPSSTIIDTPSTFASLRYSISTPSARSGRDGLNMLLD